MTISRTPANREVISRTEQKTTGPNTEKTLTGTEEEQDKFTPHTHRLNHSHMKKYTQSNIETTMLTPMS